MTTEERDRPHILQSYSAIHLEEEIKIDFIVELADRSLIPIEVKWTENPNERDARHLVRFIDENKKLCQKGFGTVHK